MTPEKEYGTRLEIIAELTLLGQAKDPGTGIYNVRRNVEIRKRNLSGDPDFYKRQVDVSYDVVQEGKLYRVLVEAKASSNGPVRATFRDGPSEKQGMMIRDIEGPVDQAYETKLFGSYDLAILITNSTFEGAVHDQAKGKVKLIEGELLGAMYSRFADGDLGKDMKDLDVGQFNLWKGVEYVR
jgi:hypothetical protein